MRGYNSIQLIGNITKDIEIKETQNGVKYAKFGLAVNHTWRDKKTNEKKDEVSFFNIMAWDKYAEIVSNYLSKGSPVFIEGRMSIRSYEDNSGIKRIYPEVIMQELRMLGGGENKKQPRFPDESDDPYANRPTPQLPRNGENYGAVSNVSSLREEENFDIDYDSASDLDIPF